MKKKGILFWVTGLSGSGKTQISKKIYPQILKKYGPTILISGDDIRNIFKIKGYSKKDRLETVIKYCKLSKLITSQNINVLFAVVGMMDEARKWNKKNIKNYVEIFIETKIKDIIKLRKKKIYQTEKKNIVGIDIKPEIPKNPDIIIKNNFKRNLDSFAKEIINKLEKISI